jgi:myo-inositol-1(or 4)-monophosphatase
LLIKEAGGLVLDTELQPLDADLSYKTRLSFIAAANKKILDDVFVQNK